MSMWLSRRDMDHHAPKIDCDAILPDSLDEMGAMTLAVVV